MLLNLPPKKEKKIQSYSLKGFQASFFKRGGAGIPSNSLNCPIFHSCSNFLGAKLRLKAAKIYLRNTENDVPHFSVAQKMFPVNQIKIAIRRVSLR